MKKYLATRMRLSALIIVGALVTTALVTPHLVEAQSASDKIRIMAETLRARDSGNLDQAKEKAEELIKIAPRDENVQRLLASINRELDRRSSRVASSVDPTQATNQDVEPSMGMQSAVITSESPTQSLSKRVGLKKSKNFRTSGSVVAPTAAESAVAEATADQNAKIAAAKDAIASAQKLVKLGAYSDASNLLNAASASLTLNFATVDIIEAVKAAKAQILLTEAKVIADNGDAKAAEALVEQYRAAGGDSSAASHLSRQLDKQISDPYQLDINEISPEYVAQNKIIRDLLAQGRAQYLNGDYDGASATFKEVEARDANNSDAKLFQTKIAELLGAIHGQNLYKTREQMLTEVDQQWERPKVFDIAATNVAEVDEGGRIKDKLNAIVIPQVNFSGMELTRVVETLSELSVEYDPERIGVNIIPLFNSNDTNPRVNISLRNLNLDRILQFVTQQVNFAYDVGGDAVTIQPSDSLGGSATSVTEFFPISRATVIRLTGFRDGGGSSSGPVDPFAAPSGGGSSGPSQNDEVEALQSFFQSAGVNFEIPGASLAFDGEQLIVTQSRRNLERMRTILRNYNEVKQVEIEAKFLEVSQSDLEEVGFDWAVNRGASQVSQLGGRNIGEAFGAVTDDSTLTIRNPGGLVALYDNDGDINSIRNINPVDERVDYSSPDLPTSADLAADVISNLYDRTSLLGFGGYEVDLLLRALNRKSGSDLMSAPKVTVLSGKRASITVAQELRYPESYGDIEPGEPDGGSVSIVAATPQDFVTRNVGVELSVTPNVENDDTISLILEPRVTEFEGFVEYGGPSVAINEIGTIVTVPAGFYQPIFSTRELSTEVTVFDGATIVMGGLTRDEVKTVNDRVPVLGDIPGLGRLFRSEGETRQKRNLLMFVTANLVSPGGSPSRQSYRNVNANALFQNPTIMTPSGSVNRSIEANAE